MAYYLDSKLKSKKSTKVYPTLKKSTQFHLPKNSTKFHHYKISADIHQELRNPTKPHKIILTTTPPQTKQKFKLNTQKYQKNWYSTIKRILKEPKPESDTDSIPNTKLKAKQETMQETIDNLNKLNTLNIHIIGATPLIQLIKKPKYMIFAVTIADIKKALAPKKHTNPTTKVLIKYYKYLDIFL